MVGERGGVLTRPTEVDGVDADVPIRPVDAAHPGRPGVPDAGDRAATSFSLLIVGITFVFLVAGVPPGARVLRGLVLLHDERLEPDRRALRRPRAARRHADHQHHRHDGRRCRSRVGHGAVHQRVRAGPAPRSSSRRSSTCSPRSRACCSGCGASSRCRTSWCRWRSSSPATSRRFPFFQLTGPTATSGAVELRRRGRRRDHDPADHHVGLARRDGPGPARAVRRRARARRNPLGDDPRGHPAVRPQRDRRRRRCSASGARSARRSPSRCIISLVFEANTHVLERGAGSIAALIAVRFGEAGSLERSGADRGRARAVPADAGRQPRRPPDRRPIGGACK